MSLSAKTCLSSFQNPLLWRWQWLQTKTYFRAHSCQFYLRNIIGDFYLMMKITSIFFLLRFSFHINFTHLNNNLALQRVSFQLKLAWLHRYYFFQLDFFTQCSSPLTHFFPHIFHKLSWLFPAICTVIYLFEYIDSFSNVFQVKLPVISAHQKLTHRGHLYSTWQIASYRWVYFSEILS